MACSSVNVLIFTPAPPVLYSIIWVSLTFQKHLSRPKTLQGPSASGTSEYHPSSWRGRLGESSPLRKCKGRPRVLVDGGPWCRWAVVWYSEAANQEVAAQRDACAGAVVDRVLRRAVPTSNDSWRPQVDILHHITKVKCGGCRAKAGMR